MATGPNDRSRVPYLLLLARPSTAVRREAAKRLQAIGLRVVAQYGQVALEVLASPLEVEAAQDLGLFSAVLRGPMKEAHLERLTPEQRSVVAQWNTRFDRGYEETKRDRTLRGRSWGDPELRPPAPHSAIDPEEFKEFLAAYERRSGRSVRRGGRPQDRPADEPGSGSDDETPIAPGRASADEFSSFERRLAAEYDDPTVGYHLARLAANLEPEYAALIADLDPEFVQELVGRFFREAACWRMTGEMAIGVVFVESSRDGGPAFGDSERAEVCQEIIDGLNWLASEHPGGDLSWVYDFQFIRIDVDDGDDSEENCPSSTSLEAGWRDPAMGQVVYNGQTYSASWTGVGDYREDMRQRNGSAHATVIFVTPYANCWHAYAGGGRIVLAKRGDWGGWGRSTLDTITAHEMSHLFGAADEYTGSGTPCSTCDSLHGCDRIPNGNCGACARPAQGCVMDGNDRRLCAYTQGQIGWSDLFVELTTGDVGWAGTDDDVWLDVGDRAFELDTADHDDRERNNREGYALWAPDLERSDVKRILIRKSPDGFAGGWRLGGVRVWFRGELICDEPEINRWLEDDDRTWVGCVSDRDLVTSLRVLITTADESWAGTDDDVTLTLAGQSWNLDNSSHDDFERGRTDSFDLDPGTGLYVSDIHSVRVRKSPDGFAGGWKLGGIRIVANGGTIYDNQAINRWLEDDDRSWSASF